MDKPVFFRRCHICGETTEDSVSEVIKCGHCGKNLAPFFYFDLKKLGERKEIVGYQQIEGVGTEDNKKLENEKLAKEVSEIISAGQQGDQFRITYKYKPLWGLAVYW
jgi:hypothetical protein